jgi:hypothetical protein
MQGGAGGGSGVQLKVELLRKPSVTVAPHVNPALKTLVQRQGFIPPTQTELTTNVKVRGGWVGWLSINSLPHRCPWVGC